MRIGIFAHTESQQARALVELFDSEQDTQCVLFDLSIPSDAETSISPDKLFFAGERVDTLDVAILHGYSYDNPVVPQADDFQDFSVWQFGYLSTQQNQSYLFSLFSEMSRRGVEVLCPPRAHVLCYEKTHLLYRLKRSGVSVPSFILSNTMDDVVEFVSKNACSVWRPSTGRALWQLFTDRQREFLINADKPPVMIAETVKGPFCRVFSFRGEPVMALKMGYPNAEPPENLEVLWEYEPSQKLREACKLIYDSSDIGWAQVMGVEGDDTFWVYDVDTDPILNWLPDAQRVSLLDSLALLLAGKQGEKKPLLEAEERSPLFLRRMLRILFDFEYAKYGN
ncbi:hypothetical protein [Maridesulfovibrio sp.]|uniref:hypothetical protein n=1 Tax=Maridesulfovibrio sp. TaxID=2795000 RepID=UPI0029C9D40B|nr:hypothetical protein [Maridesulfovibrio sp.]